MKKRILVAGAGHGGLVSASYLSEKGFKVEIFERLGEDDLGYDWHDTMRNDTFEIAGIFDASKEDYHPRKDNTFYPPSLKVKVDTQVPEGMVDIEIDRKILYRYLIARAKASGVIIHFNKEVDGPLLEDDIVVGLIVDGKEELADLVIDSAGISSNVLENLPKSYDIDREYGENDKFWAYRAYYDLIPEKVIGPNRFHVYFNFAGVRGLAWFKVTEDLADIIIGSVAPIDNEDVERVLDELRRVQPSIGEKVVRGGEIGLIPLKSTFSKIVGENYAGIGDVVSMPFPLNGSGITNSVIAGKLLAETIIEIASKNLPYSQENLWQYQVRYFQEVGCKMLPIAIMKNFLLSVPEDDMNFLFEKGIITSSELGAGGAGGEIKMSVLDIAKKVIKGFLRLPLLLELKAVGELSKKAKAYALNVPKQYDEEIVREWRNNLSKFLK